MFLVPWRLARDSDGIAKTVVVVWKDFKLGNEREYPGSATDGYPYVHALGRDRDHDGGRYLAARDRRSCWMRRISGGDTVTLTDGSIPTASSRVYDGPIVVKDSADIKAAIFRDGQLQGTPTEKKVDYHQGINKPIHYNSKLYSGYMAGGMNALLDGYRGGLT